MKTATRTLLKGVERPTPSKQARPLNPNEWVARFVEDPHNRAWVIGIRRKHDIDPPDEHPGPRLDADVRKHLSERLGTADDTGLFSSDYSGLWEGYRERVVDGVIEAITTYILAATVVPVPPRAAVEHSGGGGPCWRWSIRPSLGGNGRAGH